MVRSNERLIPWGTLPLSCLDRRCHPEEGQGQPSVLRCLLKPSCSPLLALCPPPDSVRLPQPGVHPAPEAPSLPEKHAGPGRGQLGVLGRENAVGSVLCPHTGRSRRTEGTRNPHRDEEVQEEAARSPAGIFGEVSWMLHNWSSPARPSAACSRSYLGDQGLRTR